MFFDSVYKILKLSDVSYSLLTVIRHNRTGLYIVLNTIARPNIRIIYRINGHISEYIFLYSKPVHTFSYLGGLELFIIINLDQLQYDKKKPTLMWALY